MFGLCVLDRTFAPRATAVLYLIGGAGALLLYASPSLPSIYIGTILIAFAMGGEADVLTYLASRSFTVQDYTHVLSFV